MISYRLNDKELELIKRAERITCSGYDIKGDMLDADMFIPIIEDLLYELDKLQEEYDDFKQNVKDNYKPITNKELYGDYEDYRLEKGIIN